MYSNLVARFGKSFAAISKIDVSLMSTVYQTTLRNHMQDIVYLEFSTEIAGDLLIVVLLCYYLNKARTGFLRCVSLTLIDSVL